MNKNNLVKLAKFILSEVTDENFDMEEFRSNYDRSEIEFFSKNDCGTVGCALGWSPFVPGLETIGSDFCYWGGDLLFANYSERVFGVGVSDNFWRFLFDSGWYEIDNSREGFVKRVIYLIEGGKNFKLTKSNYENIDPNKIYEY